MNRFFRIPAVFASAVAALAATSTTASAATPTEQQARKIGAEAYVYGLAPVDEQRVTSAFPPNTFINVTQLATPAEQLVVLPNADTLYTNAKLDLSNGPVVVHVPEESGRYYVLQLLDGYTNTFNYIGRRTTGTHAGDYAITPPGWKGTLPEGVHRIDAPTPTVWILGRTLVNGPGDVANANAIQRGYTTTPLGGAAQPAIFLPSAVSKSQPLPTGLKFFDALGTAMAQNPAPKSEAKLLERFASVGIGPGRTPSTESLPAAVRKGLVAGANDGQRQIDAYAAKISAASARKHNGWLVPPADAGNFGTDYLLRAQIAQDAIGANRPEEAIYPSTTTDSSGRALSGAHRYVLHFAKGELPPVSAFWSLTMYNQNRFLVKNPIDRYSVGDRTQGLKRNADGSLDILLQASKPTRRASNWLPAPKGSFNLTLRLYQPKPSVLKGTWPLPTIKRVG